MNFRLGSDPEVFLCDATGKHISAIGYINADKWNPMQIPDMPEGYTLQEDNVSLEYGIPPAASAEQFIEHIENVMDKSLAYLPGLHFSQLSCTIFTEDQMQTPQAHVFGCEPDFCAWTEEANPKPQPPHPFMRSAGGHVHVETELDKSLVIKAMDLFLGVPSVLMDHGEDRKQLYGKAGAYRPKKYGVEYRTLSNFWIFSPTLIKWVWNSTERALRLASQGDDFSPAMRDTILKAINQNDKEAAKFLVDAYNMELV
jgi:hypothetical protein